MRLDLGRRRVHVFTSDSEPGRIHAVIVRRNGTVCTCPAFAFHRACWHVEDVRGRTQPLRREPWCNHDAAAVIDGVCECGKVVS